MQGGNKAKPRRTKSRLINTLNPATKPGAGGINVTPAAGVGGEGKFAQRSINRARFRGVSGPDFQRHPLPRPTPHRSRVIIISVFFSDGDVAMSSEL